MKFQIDQRGLTLVEALITLAIGTVVGGMLLVIMVNTGGLFYKESSRLQQGLNINDALSRINESVKESAGVETGYPSPSPTYTSSATSLVLKIPSQNQQGLIIQNTFDHFVFFLDGTKLRFKIFPDSQSSRKSADQIFSTSVNSLFFQYYDGQTPPQETVPTSAAKVRVTLQLKQKAGAAFEINTATTEAKLRNQ